MEDNISRYKVGHFEWCRIPNPKGTEIDADASKEKTRPGYFDSKLV